MSFRAQYMILADSVQDIGNGKLNILGTFDRWTVPEIPAIVRGFVAVVLLVAEHEDDLGDHRITARLVRPDGRVSGESGNDLKVVPNPGAFGLASVRFVAGLQGVPFYESGSHRVEVLIDGKPCAWHPLQVIIRPKNG